MRTVLRHFPFSILWTVVALVGVLLDMGFSAMLVILVLIAIEIAFSFDNAILNAKILDKLSTFWQQLFLTVGVILAIVVMRLVFPILIVALAAHLSWSSVVDLALHHPEEYAHKLELAHPAIAAFGGAFLLTLTLYFFWDSDKQIHWLKRLERLTSRIGKWWAPPLLAVLTVGLCAILPWNHHAIQTWQAGLLGIGVYVAIKLFIDGLGSLAGQAKNGLYTGWAAFGAFVYLQILDASFSFDGVLGAFAITNEVILIAIGLGVGALWVRSLTVFMVRKGTLKVYKYLEHGAHYAIGVLAVALLVSIFYNVPDAITGAIGLGVIGSSFMASRQALQSSRG